MRRRLSNPWTRAFLVWTAVVALAAVVLFFVAIAGFLRSADFCYFQIGPCSAAGDPNFVLMQIAVFWIPMVWLAGVLVGVVARAIGRRR